MRKILLPVSLLLLALLLIGCDLSPNLTPMEGEIYWEDSGTLPPGSTVSVGIINPGLGRIGETSFEAHGSSPVNFIVEYDESAVEDSVNYAASVRIKDQYDDIIYLSKTAHVVIQNGVVVNPIRILVEPVDQQ